MIPDEVNATQPSKEAAGEGGSKESKETASVEVPQPPTSQEDVAVDEGSRRMSMSASQEEHLDMGSDHEDAEDGEIDDDEEEESTDGDEDDGKADGAGKGRVKSDGSRDKKSIPPLGEYIVNVVHFLESILSNNSTDDHMQEFISQDGLRPLLKILSLPVLSTDFPMSTACQAIAGPCRSILVSPPTLTSLYHMLFPKLILLLLSLSFFFFPLFFSFFFSFQK